MSRRLTLFLLASMLGGGGWFWLNPPTGNPLGAVGNAFLGRTGQSGDNPADSYSNPGAYPVAQTPSANYAPAGPPPQRGGPALRIASFNIQVFGDSKASKPYIMQTLALIVRNFQVVAIQEIRSQDDYLLDRFLRDYVNAGGGRYYDYVVGPRLGRSNSKEQYAFIYDTAAVEINRQGVYTINDPQDLLHREPLVALFRARGPAPQQAFTFVLVNIHTDPDETDEELDALADVYHAVRRASGGEDDIIILGDLNVDDRHLGPLGQIPGVRPIVSNVFTNTRQNRLYDNIVLHQPSAAEFTGRWGVYDVQKIHQLTMDQALQVSDHFPVWAEFSMYEGAGPGRVASRGAPESAIAPSTAR